MPRYQNSVLNNCQSAVKYRIQELEAEINYLEMVISTQAQLIVELQWQINPYSQDGESLCNSAWLKGMD